MSPTLLAEETRAADVRTIESVFKAYKKTLENGDLEAWLALWTDDLVQMPDGAPSRIGKPELRVRTRDMLAVWSLEFGAEDTQEVRVAGDWAFSRGTYTATFTPRAGGRPFMVDGKFLTIFQRLPDGTWKIHRDIFNSNVAR